MSKPSDHQRLNLMIRGFQVSRMLRLAAELAIADRVPREGTIDVADLAQACAVQTLPLLRVLRALSSQSVFSLDAAGFVAHTPLSLLLRTDTEGSLRSAALVLAAPGSWAAWNELDAALHGGVPHRKAWDMSRFEYLCKHPAEGRHFDAWMGQGSGHRHEAVAAAYDFSTAASIVDIGGGNGALLRTIAQRHAGPRGIVFDREDVVAAIAPRALEEGLEAGRITAVGGDFFAQVPAGADLYLLARVLHDWPDDDCLRILRACRRAMRADGRLLVIEQLPQPDPAKGAPIDYLSDMQMMAMFGSARERTREEFAELLHSAGFECAGVIETASPASIVQGRPLQSP
jgi:ubiquinone/menaquinone biosynthesis C-methylase UbiE